MTKTAIIGANRFIGFQLCNYLLNEGEEVKAYTHNAHSRERMLQEEMELLLGRSANLIREKVEDKASLFDRHDEFQAVYFTFFDQGDFNDTIFLRNKIKQAYKALKDCILYCLQTKTRLIFLSSLNVYGKQQYLINEDIIPVPDSIEGRLFLHFEKVITKFSEENLSFIIVRLPTVYGPWQPLSNAYQQACVQSVIKENVEITIQEDTRDVLFIDDVISVMTALQSNIPDEVLHLSSGRLQEWEEGAKLLNIPYDELKKGALHAISYEKAAELLHFSPTINVHDGILRQMYHTRQLWGRFPFL